MGRSATRLAIGTFAAFAAGNWLKTTEIAQELPR